MNEIWKDIKEYEGHYQVSNLGRVKSIKIVKGIVREKLLKPIKNKTGYLSVHLSKNNIKKIFRINRLVATAFIPNTEMKPYVNHKNEIKEDNRAENLNWVSAKENTNWGTLRQRQFHNNVKPVLQYSLKGDFLREFYSIEEAKRILNINSNHISEACAGKLKSACGFIWKYKEAL